MQDSPQSQITRRGVAPPWHPQVQVAPAQGWPTLAAHQGALQHLRQDLQAKSAVIAEKLAGASARLERAEREVQQARQTLEVLCRSFPTYTLQGMLQLVMQPWRWSRWWWSRRES